jgi:hypothetical protein
MMTRLMFCIELLEFSLLLFLLMWVASLFPFNVSTPTPQRVEAASTDWSPWVNTDTLGPYIVSFHLQEVRVMDGDTTWVYWVWRSRHDGK